MEEIPNRARWTGPALLWADDASSSVSTMPPELPDWDDEVYPLTWEERMWFANIDDDVDDYVHLPGWIDLGNDDWDLIGVVCHPDLGVLHYLDSRTRGHRRSMTI